MKMLTEGTFDFFFEGGSGGAGVILKKYPASSILVPKQPSCTRPLPKTNSRTFFELKKIMPYREKNNTCTHVSREKFLVHERVKQIPAYNESLDPSASPQHAHP